VGGVYRAPPASDQFRPQKNEQGKGIGNPLSTRGQGRKAGGVLPVEAKRSKGDFSESGRGGCCRTSSTISQGETGAGGVKRGERKTSAVRERRFTTFRRGRIQRSSLSHRGGDKATRNRGKLRFIPSRSRQGGGGKGWDRGEKRMTVPWRHTNRLQADTS